MEEKVQLQPGGGAGGRPLAARRTNPPPGSMRRIEGVGVRALPGGRRVDVAVDLGSCRHDGPEWRGEEGESPCLRLELAMESPTGRHGGSATLLDCQDRAVDLVMHLRGDPEPGEYTLHVGLFWGEALLQHEWRTFRLPLAATGESAG